MLLKKIFLKKKNRRKLNFQIMIGLLITYRNVAFLLIFNMILGLLDQLQIVQLYLIEMLGLLTGLGLL